MTKLKILSEKVAEYDKLRDAYERLTGEKAADQAVYQVWNGYDRLCCYTLLGICICLPGVRSFLLRDPNAYFSLDILLWMEFLMGCIALCYSPLSQTIATRLAPKKLYTKGKAVRIFWGRSSELRLIECKIAELGQRVCGLNAEFTTWSLEMTDKISAELLAMNEQSDGTVFWAKACSFWMDRRCFKINGDASQWYQQSETVGKDTFRVFEITLKRNNLPPEISASLTNVRVGEFPWLVQFINPDSGDAIYRIRCERIDTERVVQALAILYSLENTWSKLAETSRTMLSRLE